MTTPRRRQLPEGPLGKDLEQCEEELGREMEAVSIQADEWDGSSIGRPASFQSTLPAS